MGGEGGRGGARATILRQLVAPTRAEPGCLQYDVHRDAGDPRVFVLWERYADAAALDAHTEAAYVQDLVFAQALPLLDERVRTYLDPLGDRSRARRSPPSSSPPSRSDPRSSASGR